MRQNCKFSPDRDLAAHRPLLHLDLETVFDTMQIPASGAFSTDFEDVDDTDSIGPRIEDTFDAIEYGIALNENIKAREYTSGTGNNTTPQIVNPSEGGAE